jgi:hypothetical protein
MNMKYAVLALVLAAAPAWADKNISVTIDGVNYSCSGTGGGTGDCAGKAAGFRATLEACKRSNGGGYCAETYWPKYKASNPNCVADGIPACIDFCSMSNGGGYCADKCS